MKRLQLTISLDRFLPFLNWFERYNFRSLQADFIAGLTVALVLIPQSMAYAQLAGLPSYYGLYAAFLPPIVAALFGSSRQLATGPVAVVSLMTATALSSLAPPSSEAFIAYAILLSLIVGLFQFLLGSLRLGFIVNFISHPVVNGFTNAAALIIATSQLDKLLGVEAVKAENHCLTVYNILVAATHGIHWPSFALALLAFIIMLVCKRLDRRIPNVLLAVLVTTLISKWSGFEHNSKVGINQIASLRVRSAVVEYNQVVEEVRSILERRVDLSAKLQQTKKQFGDRAPEILEVKKDIEICDIQVEATQHQANSLRQWLSTRVFYEAPQPGDLRLYQLSDELPTRSWRTEGTWRLKVGSGRLDQATLTMIGGGLVVGAIPRGLPRLTWPKVKLNAALDLLTMAIVISMLGFMEAISIAKAIASRTGHRLDPNQELIGQGLANIVGSFSQAYPVSGSFSRSAVNLQAGALTGMSNLFGSVIVVLTLLFFTPLLYYLPQSVLAAIIMVAVVNLLNVRGFIHAWQAQRYDGVIAIVSFVLTLTFAPHLDWGILVGIALTLGLALLRNMNPDLAILSKHPDGSYRSAERHGLERCRHVAVVRFSGSLFFANVNYLEDKVLEQVSSMPELKIVLIVGNGINELDASGEVLLSHLVTRLRERGIEVTFSGLNDQVLDVMRRTHLYEKIGAANFYRSVAVAVQGIHQTGVCIDDPSRPCPLVEVVMAQPTTPLTLIRALKP